VEGTFGQSRMDRVMEGLGKETMARVGMVKKVGLG
jgi:hypothetical protein